MGTVTRVARLLAGALLLPLCIAPAQDVSLQQGDVVHRQAFLPSALNRHGQFRLIQRGPDLCVAQTVLCSTSLRRGLKEIRTREAFNWPEDRQEYADSRMMLAALDRSYQALATPTSPPPDRLMMEFTSAPQGGTVTFYAIEVVTTGDTWRVTSTHALARLVTRPAYAQRCIQLQSESAFHLEGADLQRLLADAGWIGQHTISASDANRPALRAP